MLIDVKAIQQFLAEVVRHYETSAPTVSRWADDLYIRLNEDIYSVTFGEVLRAQTLRENGIWEHPNFAANRVFHLMTVLKQDTTGYAGF